MNELQLGTWKPSVSAPLLWILGPCVIESRELTLTIAERLKELAESKNLHVVFKASFDKANRSSSRSFRGVGLDAGLQILAEVKSEFNLPVTTDVHEPSQCAMVAEVCDVLQIPAFLCRQTDLLLAAAATQRIVNVKKGQFVAPWDMKHAVEKIRQVGNQGILLTERGTSFGYGMLVNDMRSIPWMQELGCPVIFDATHSVQTPGSLGDRTGGDSRMVPYLAQSAVATGAEGLFLETHPNPADSPSDGPNMIPLDQLPKLIDLATALRMTLINKR